VERSERPPIVVEVRERQSEPSDRDALGNDELPFLDPNLVEVGIDLEPGLARLDGLEDGRVSDPDPPPGSQAEIEVCGGPLEADTRQLQSSPQ
jgi:hypothetical protein